MKNAIEGNAEHVITVEQKEPYLKVPEGEGLLLRPHQREIYDAPTARHILDTAPGGAGKTLGQQALCLKEIDESHYLQRQCIAVPQQVQGLQFAKKRLLRLSCHESCFDKATNKFTCHHVVTPFFVPDAFNLCHEDANGTIDKVIAFLTRSQDDQKQLADELAAKQTAHPSTDGLILVTTHTSLVAAFRKMKETMTSEELRASSRNLTFRIDEAHHAGETELGKIVSFICEDEDPSAKIAMTTATPFRSTGKPVIPPKYGHDFKRYTLPLFEYLSRTGIEKIVISLVQVEDDDILDYVMADIEHDGPDSIPYIVYPRHNQAWLRGRNKMAVVKSGKKRLEKMGRTVAQFIGEDQDEAKYWTVKHPENFTAFQTVSMGREGLDMPHVNFIAHTAIENSLWLSVQTFYRELRSSPGKKEVKITYYVPPFIDLKDGGVATWKEFAARTTLHLLDKLHDMVKPRDAGQGQPRMTLISKLASVLKGDDAAGEAIRDLVINMMQLQCQGLSKEETVKKIMIALKVHLHLSEDEIKEQKFIEYFLDTFKRMTAAIRRVRVGFKGQMTDAILGEAGALGIFVPSKLKQLEAAVYGAGAEWLESLTKLEEVWDASKTFEENYDAVSLELKRWISDQKCLFNTGRLSDYAISKLNSLPGWSWESLRTSLEEHVAIAEDLMAKHGPLRQKYFVAAGASSTYQQMQKYPEAFAHLKWVEKTTEEDYVEEAKGLAAGNGGVLQNAGWLQANGHNGLAQYMCKHPDAFADIPQLKLTKSLDETVALAEKLAKENLENAGVLQNSKWLEDNGYGAINQAKRKYPERFNHIPQESKKGKSVDEWVMFAKKLVEENPDGLPSFKELIRTGYSGLARVWIKFPDKFADIKRAPRKTGHGHGAYKAARVRHEKILAFVEANPGMSQGAIAKHFNINQSTVSLILKKKKKAEGAAIGA
jgi:hypothetical protein